MSPLYPAARDALGLAAEAGSETAAPNTGRAAHHSCASKVHIRCAARSARPASSENAVASRHDDANRTVGSTRPQMRARPRRSGGRRRGAQGIESEGPVRRVLRSSPRDVQRPATPSSSIASRRAPHGRSDTSELFGRLVRGSSHVHALVNPLTWLTCQLGRPPANIETQRRDRLANLLFLQTRQFLTDRSAAGTRSGLTKPMGRGQKSAGVGCGPHACLDGGAPERDLGCDGIRLLLRHVGDRLLGADAHMIGGIDRTP
jgi:hypothetical protein